MSQVKQLKAETRAKVGKGAARAARLNGKLPAVIYGAGKPPVAITVDFKETNKLIYAGHFKTTIFEIDVDGKKEQVIPRDFTMDPVRDFPVHIDFLRVGKNSSIRVEVPIHFLNAENCAAIKQGGSLEVVMHSLELSCPANAIPESIDVDLTKLGMGEVVHLSSIVLPKGAKALAHEEDATLAIIVAPKTGSADADDAPVAATNSEDS